MSEMTALQTGAVLTCVNIIAGAIASMPLPVYERQIRDGRPAKRLAIDHPLFDLLRLTPNPEMTSATFRATLQCHMLLWGNGYAEIQRDGAAQPIALWPRNPARTRPVRIMGAATIEGTRYPAGTLMYTTNEMLGDEISAEDDQINRGPERTILAEDMLHIPGLSLDGRLGQSTIYLARQIIGLALATEKYGAKFFGNGAVPRGILYIPGALEPKAIENLRRSWQEAHGGENAHKTAVLEAGVKYEPIGVNPQESQLLETQKQARLVVATMFNVPPHMVGESEKSKSNVEQTSIEFLNYCLNTWLVRWEQELERKLFLPPSALVNPDKKKFFAKFDTWNLVYPDAASRSAYYHGGKYDGYFSSNDILEMEGRNPIEDGSGDVHWAPVNMIDAATGYPVGQSEPPEGEPTPPDATVHELRDKDEHGYGSYKQGYTEDLHDVSSQPEHTVGEPAQFSLVRVGDKLVTEAGTKYTVKEKGDTTLKVYDHKTNELKDISTADVNGKLTWGSHSRRVFPADHYCRVYSHLFVSAFGRLALRSSKKVEDFQRVLRPVLYAIAEEFSTQIAASRDLEALPADSFDKFITGYIAGVHKRCGDLTKETVPEITWDETSRAVCAVEGAVLKSLGDPRANPDHHLQPRTDDGTWQPGKVVAHYAMRHGHTPENDDRKYRSWLENELDTKGENEIRASAEWLKDKGITKIVTGTLRRLRSSAAITAEVLGGREVAPQIAQDARANSWNIGVFIGKSITENQKQLDWYISNPDEVVPNGESLSQFKKRNAELFDEIEKSGVTTLLVTNRSNIAARVGDTFSGYKSSSESVGTGGVVRIAGDGVKIVFGSTEPKGSIIS